MNVRSAALSVALAASTLCLGGCLITSSSKSYQSGTYVSRATLNQIEPGKTDQEFVLAVLGPPSSQTTLHDGAELWKWEYTRRHTSSGAVLFLVASGSESENRVTSFVLFRQGIVERVWQDE
jgi:outer membrane protein assembly factor BamE (lipoprotein component of BamABCDE complex)